MAADPSGVRSRYIAGLQTAAKLIIQLQGAINNLSTMYQGNTLAGSFVDAELAADVTTKHLIATDIATMTGQLNTVNGAITTNIAQSMAKATGVVIPGV